MSVLNLDGEFSDPDGSDDSVSVRVKCVVCAKPFKSECFGQILFWKFCVCIYAHMGVC